MKTRMLTDLVTLKVDKDQFSKTMVGDKVFHKDLTYGGLDSGIAAQDGIVLAVPYQITNNGYHDEDIKVNIEVGDRVFCHHHLTEFSHIKDDIYTLPYHLLYCKKNDSEVEMLDPWNFLTPIKQEKVGGFELPGRNDYQKAVVNYASPSLKAQGVKQGDTVVYLPGMDADVLVDGVSYYRTLTRHILGVVEEAHVYDEL